MAVSKAMVVVWGKIITREVGVSNIIKESVGAFTSVCKLMVDEFSERNWRTGTSGWARADRAGGRIMRRRLFTGCGMVII